MKKLLGLLVLIVVASLCVAVTPATAQQGFADNAGHFGKNAQIPQGHVKIVAAYLDQFLSTGPGAGGGRHMVIENLTDGIDDPLVADELADFFVVDVRTPAEYCAGTVPGAVNIPLTDLAKLENIAVLPKNFPILFVCNTGHQATAALVAMGTLGYDVWLLRFGMTSWKPVSNVKIWTKRYGQDLYGMGLPVQKCE